MTHPPCPSVRRRDRQAYHQVGSDGTPEISEFAAVELGMLLETTTGSAEVLLRDALDLRHRLPKVWDAVMTGRVEDWRARKVVAAVRSLTLEQARQVDVEVLDAVLGLPLGRALDVVHGRVIAADPEKHRARCEAEEQRRYVSTGRRSNPHGLRTLIAQTLSGDVARLEAMVAHLASLLADAGDTDPVDTRRAKALGLLANPALACVLLADAATETTETAETAEAPRRSRTRLTCRPSSSLRASADCWPRWVPGWSTGCDRRAFSTCTSRRRRSPESWAARSAASRAEARSTWRTSRRCSATTGSWSSR